MLFTYHPFIRVLRLSSLTIKALVTRKQRNYMNSPGSDSWIIAPFSAPIPLLKAFISKIAAQSASLCSSRSPAPSYDHVRALKSFPALRGSSGFGFVKICSRWVSDDPQMFSLSPDLLQIWVQNRQEWWRREEEEMWLGSGIKNQEIDWNQDRLTDSPVIVKKLKFRFLVLIPSPPTGQHHDWLTEH